MLAKPLDALLTALESRAFAPKRIKQAARLLDNFAASTAESALYELQRTRLAETLANAAEKSPCSALHPRLVDRHRERHRSASSLPCFWRS